MLDRYPVKIIIGSNGKTQISKKWSLGIAILVMLFSIFVILSSTGRYLVVSSALIIYAIAVLVVPLYAFMKVFTDKLETFTRLSTQQKLEISLLIVIVGLGVEAWFLSVLGLSPITDYHPIGLLKRNFLMVMLVGMPLVFAPLSLVLGRFGYLMNPYGGSWFRRALRNLVLIPTCLVLGLLSALFLGIILTSVFPEPRGWLLLLYMAIEGVVTLTFLLIIAWSSLEKSPWRAKIFSKSRVVTAFLLSCATFFAILFPSHISYYVWLAHRQYIQEGRDAIPYVPLKTIPFFTIPSGIIITLLLLLFLTFYSATTQGSKSGNESKMQG